MKEKLESLIKKYEVKLIALKEQGHDECYDCCDYTAVGENESCIEEFIKELKIVTLIHK